MKRNSIKSIFSYTILGLGALFFINCSGYNTVVKMQEINVVPVGQYERIVKLSNPDGAPYKTLAGVVFIRKGASICTDYPREEVIKSIDELSMIEKHRYPYFSNYEIKSEAETWGYISIPVDYRVILWKNETDENCKYKVQIISIYKERSDVSEETPKSESGGHGN
jgi:hypothetical protein